MASMPVLEAQQDPSEAGFDATRLERISRRRASSTMRLPCWSMALSRAGRIVYTAASGMRDIRVRPARSRGTRCGGSTRTSRSRRSPRCTLGRRGGSAQGSGVAVRPGGRTSGVPRGDVAQAGRRQHRSRFACRHLLTHAAGLTYGFPYAHPVDALYRAQGFEWTMPSGVDPWRAAARAGPPSAAVRAGSGWNYSVATDVLGRWSRYSRASRSSASSNGGSSDLGMGDTGCWVGEDDAHRLAALYAPTARRPRCLRPRRHSAAAAGLPVGRR